jgi:hypothetical protein
MDLVTGSLRREKRTKTPSLLTIPPALWEIPKVLPSLFASVSTMRFERRSFHGVSMMRAIHTVNELTSG